MGEGTYDYTSTIKRCFEASGDALRLRTASYCAFSISSGPTHLSMDHYSIGVSKYLGRICLIRKPLRPICKNVT